MLCLKRRLACAPFGQQVSIRESLHVPVYEVDVRDIVMRYGKIRMPNAVVYLSI